MMTKILKQDAERYESISRMPRFQKFLRKYQTASNPLSKLLYRFYTAFLRAKITLRFHAILKSERDYISGIRFV